MSRHRKRASPQAHVSITGCVLYSATNLIKHGTPDQRKGRYQKPFTYVADIYVSTGPKQDQGLETLLFEHTPIDGRSPAFPGKSLYVSAE